MMKLFPNSKFNSHSRCGRRVVNKYSKAGEEQHMRCPVHLSIGQEAAAVGACTHLTRNDRILQYGAMPITLPKVAMCAEWC